MYSLLRRFIDICLLRAGPQDLPDSPFLLQAALLGYTIAGLLVSTSNQGLWIAVMLVGIDIALISGLLFMLLWSQRLGNRYRQTFIAILGTGFVLEVISWPIMIWQRHNIAHEGISNALMFSSLLLWAWLFWNVIVLGHIIRHALSTRFPVGISLGILYLFLSFNISRMILSGQGG